MKYIIRIIIIHGIIIKISKISSIILINLIKSYFNLLFILLFQYGYFSMVQTIKISNNIQNIKQFIQYFIVF